MQTLATIGYEGASLEDFLATLLLAEVKRVIDIRELPQSRRRGFSKNILARALEVHGIAYSHIRALGDPKHGREAARAGRFDEFRQIFYAHIDRPEARDALALAATLAGEARSALLCYERNPKHCHRSIVADRLNVLYTFQVNHLGVVNGEAKRQFRTVGREGGVSDCTELHSS